MSSEAHKYSYFKFHVHTGESSVFAMVAVLVTYESARQEDYEEDHTHE